MLSYTSSSQPTVARIMLAARCKRRIRCECVSLGDWVGTCASRGRPAALTLPAANPTCIEAHDQDLQAIQPAHRAACLGLGLGLGLGL
eukprot:scaffold18497_cov76-Phaeocystis_antarctica.AAC.1